MVRLWIQSRTFLLGLTAGLTGFALAGHAMSGSVHFDNFLRFYPPLQPQLQFFPSPFEVVNTIEQNYDDSKVLVIVGGSSIFRGVGQNASDLWTRRLQRNLGNGYAVFNISIDQQTLEGFGSVVFRILHNRHKKVLYVGLSSTEGISSMDGLPVYKYFFWDAYYSGLLKLQPDDESVAKRLRREELATLAGQNLHVSSWLESIFRYRVLWNEFSYRVAFTAFVANTGQDWTSPRDSYPDLDVEWKAVQLRVRQDKYHHELIEGRLTKIAHQDQGADETDMSRSLRDSLFEAFSEELRPYIFAVLTLPNPEYIDGLSEEDRKLLMRHYDRSLKIHQQLGFRSKLVGFGFSADQYIDQGHLMASGSNELADQIAPEIRSMARDRNFLRP